MEFFSQVMSSHSSLDKRQSSNTGLAQDSLDNGMYYEMWSKFSLEKVIEGALRINKGTVSGRDLQVKQLE